MSTITEDQARLLAKQFTRVAEAAGAETAVADDAIAKIQWMKDEITRLRAGTVA